MCGKVQITVIIFTTFVWSITSFTQQYLGNVKHPEKPNHCYFEEYNISLPINHTVYPTNIDAMCFKVYCRQDFVLIIKHCDRVMINRYCDEGRYDYSRPYPQCCPVIKCKYDNV